MTDERKRKKAAQAIQAMLELDGIKATVKDISVKIEGENLTDLMKLKDKLANDMRAETKESTGNTTTDRRRVIGDFVVTNWNLLEDNEVVKTALLNAYCMGRYKKEQREAMASELLGRVGVTIEKTEAPADVKVSTKKDQPEETQEAQETETTEEVLDHRQYTF